MLDLEQLYEMKKRRHKLRLFMFERKNQNAKKRSIQMM